MTAPHVATAGLLLETSLGSLTVDVLGADCPALSANFLNLCRAQFWNGAVATEVIPEVAVFFSLTADPTYHSLLCKALDSHGAPDTMQTFLALLPPAATTLNDQPDVVGQQRRALHAAMQQEARLCKRRRCTGLSTPSSSSAGACRPVFAATTAGGLSSPCSVAQAGCLLVDVTAPTLRFGLTLSSRSMEFLDRQYVTIGHVVEGEAVLRRLQRLPFRDRPVHVSPAARRVAGQDDSVGGRPASSWPQPLRMLRLKRALVLPTAGTDKYLSSSSSSSSASRPLSVLSGTSSAAEAQRRRQRVGELLHQAGCFEWWASAAAVHAAQGHLVEVVAAYLAAKGYEGPPARPRSVTEATALVHGTSGSASPSSSSLASAPLIILRDVSPSSTSSPTPLPLPASDRTTAVEVAYNPHATGAFLSSDDEEDGAVGKERGGQGSSGGQSARQLEERRRAFMQQHQEKANETLSLMLNVLNGVADTRGDIKPPENVLFVCKLNPVTTGDGLALCFAQFGRVVAADVIQDSKTKQSLCYGFVEFETVEACFRAFQKMDRALIDDCRIHVDFSQSVSKLWAQRQREMRKRDRPS